MQSFNKLHFIAILAATLAVNLTFAAPLHNDGLEVIERSEDINSDIYAIAAADMEMDQDFSISDFANKVKAAANKVKEGVKKAAIIAKPIVDTAADIAQYTPLAPEAAIVHKVVDKAASL